MNSGPVGVGVVGAGDVSHQYLEAFREYPDIRVRALADVDTARVRERAAEFDVQPAASVDDLLADPTVELIVNLTPPANHVPVSLAAVQAGKHIWSEKPLGLDRASAAELLAAADRHGVLVGCAPDTVLGRGIQSAAAHLQDNLVGRPLTLLTLMQGPGPDRWHPRPEFLFRRGAGPLFDIGPYYVTTMVMLLGSVRRVTAIGHRASPTRVIATGPLAGETFPVDICTHVGVLTEFASGVVATAVYSFDSPVPRQLFEVTGATGTMTVPVSGFDGPTVCQRQTDGGRVAVDELAPAGTVRDRGVGALEMARALRAGGSARASGALAYHVLDVLLAVEESIAARAPVSLHSTAPAVAPLDPAWDPQERTL